MSQDNSEAVEDVKTVQIEKVFNYDEAIELAGNGTYNFLLLMTMCLGTLSMALDVFGISVVMPPAACEFHLDLKKAGILLSVTFIGPIIMAYPWGYLADTKGRKRSLLISLWVSFIVSTLSAFSPNWIVLAVLKFIGTSFSSCAQSVTFTLLGESCSKRVRDSYMLIIAGLVDISAAFYVGIAYLILKFELSVNLSFMIFGPWRFIILALALPLGISATLLHFFYESPKFHINKGETEEALKSLRGIWKMNGTKIDCYPVQKIDLNEETSSRDNDISILRSLWEQLNPLFKPPLLWRSLQLYFLAAVIYSTNNGYYIWFPFLAQNFIEGVLGESNDDNPGLCSLIIGARNSSESMECTTKLDIRLFWACLAEGLLFMTILLGTARITRSKRHLVVSFLFVSGACAVGAVLVKNSIASFIMFIGIFLNELAIGFIYSYYVDLYPTSYSGTAACLGTMVGRGTALAATNLLGFFIESHCSHTFYITSALMFVGVIVACMLPSQKTKIVTNDPS